MARAIAFFGKLMKLVGVVISALVFLGGMLAADSSGAFRGNEGTLALFLSVLGAGIAWLFIWAVSVCISAMGQQTLASLDTAVNTSPFLADDQRAAMMGVD